MVKSISRILILFILFSSVFGQIGYSIFDSIDEFSWQSEVPIIDPIIFDIIVQPYTLMVVPVEEVWQIWDNNEWNNRVRRTYFSPFLDNVKVTVYNWEASSLKWTESGIYAIDWTTGNTQAVTYYNSITATLDSKCEFSGQFYKGIPEIQIYYRWSNNAWFPSYRIVRTFDSNGNPIQESGYSWQNSAWVPKKSIVIEYSSSSPNCPDKKILSTHDGVNWNQELEKRFLYDLLECIDNYVSINPFDVNNCIPTLIEIRDLDDNIVKTEERTHDVGDCLMDLLVLAFSNGSEIEWIKISSSWEQKPQKISVAYDASNSRLVKAIAEQSEDGINWTNYARAWISYDGLQMGAEEIVSTPILFELNQNYPNPFNPITTITYELTRESNVSIKIYNSLGNEVKTITNEFTTVGHHQIIWDGTDNIGETVAVGTYFCQLKAGEYIETKKMLLLK